MDLLLRYTSKVNWYNLNDGVPWREVIRCSYFIPIHKKYIQTVLMKIREFSKFPYEHSNCK